MPPLWLLIAIVALPLVAETIYSPVMPTIARSLAVAESEVEFTLTIFLWGFAVGTLVWGILSDWYGRKYMLLAGIAIFIIGCVGCYSAATINGLMICRFIQAFGGSTGSVLGQALCRDLFQGSARGLIFSVITTSLACAPAVGPLFGSWLDYVLGWHGIFMVLAFLALVLMLLIYRLLPETHNGCGSFSQFPTQILRHMVVNKKVIAYGLLVGVCNGISFSYYAEGSFYLINLLHVSPQMFGLTFVLLSVASITGGCISRRMHADGTSGHTIMRYGSYVVLGGSLLFVAFITAACMISHTAYCIAATVLGMSALLLGTNVLLPTLLSSALSEYGGAIGIASSFFGFFYYTIISLCTGVMGIIHDKTLYPMPLYFLLLSIIVFIVTGFITQRATNNQS